MIRDWRETQERIEARTDEYVTGKASEAVYRANLFALGMRGEELNIAARAAQHKRLEKIGRI